MITSVIPLTLRSRGGQMVNAHLLIPLQKVSCRRFLSINTPAHQQYTNGPLSMIPYVLAMHPSSITRSKATTTISDSEAQSSPEPMYNPFVRHLSPS